jgi:surface antigen
MEFTPRYEVPNNNNKYYVNTNRGGYNKCIIRNQGNGFVLPNCVGYSYGRFMECGEMTSCKLSAGNAKGWWTHKDGYKRGLTPKVGAVACWTNNGAGHVASVEEVNSDGSIVISMSNYTGTYKNGRFFQILTLKKGYKISGLTFQGFIYNPVDFDTITKIKLPTRGYFKKGDKSQDVAKIDQWLYELYRDKNVLGDLYWDNTVKYVKKFQKEAKKKGIYNDNIDGCIGKKTLNAMRECGFPY